MHIKAFSRKTIGIAIATAVVTGGVAIPQAGAMGGYTYNKYVINDSALHEWAAAHPDATGDELNNYRDNEIPLIPNPAYDKISTVWSTTSSNDAWAGYATKLPSDEGEIEGLLVTPSGATGSPLSRRKTFKYGPARSLKDIQNDFHVPGGVEARPLSLDTKRVLYTAARLGQASVNGITPEIKTELENAGYNINSAKRGLAESMSYEGDYGTRTYTEQDIKDGTRKEKNEAPIGERNSIITATLTDYLFTTLSTVTGSAWESDADLSESGDPATLDQIRGAAKQNTPLGLDSHPTDYDLFVDAVLKIASTVTEEDIENSNIPVYLNESGPLIDKFYSQPAIDVANAKFNVDQDDPTTPAKDLHVTNVEKQPDGNYEVTRSDGEKWTIDLSDLNKRITDLENKKTVSPDDLKTVQDELDKAKSDISDLKGKDAETDKAIKEINDKLGDLTPRVEKLESRVDALEKSVIKEVRDNKDGTYTLIREDGSEVKGKIDTSGSITNIKPDGKGNLIVTIDGKDQTIPLSQTTVTESNKGKPGHTITITTPDGKSVTFDAFDNYVTNVEKQPNGDYKVIRNDGTEWTIELKDIRDKIAELENKDTVSPGDLKTVQDELDKAKKDIDGLKGEDDKINKELDKIKKEVDGLDGRIDKLEDRVTDLENNSIKEVRDNGDGTYTIIRNDGSEVPGKIDTSGSITNIKSDGKGNLIVTIDGEDKTVPLDKVKVTEKNKGKPGHTITITTPDGKSVTFDAFDNYVTNVEKQPNGDYLVTRNDGETWTIELKDIRDKIAKLEAQESPSRADYDKIKDELDKLNKKVEDLKAGDKEIKGDIADLRSDITKINNRLITIETRLTVVEKHTNDLTKCVAGAGMATIPALLGIPLMMLSQVNIPGLQYLNTSIQKQIGIYNPELARQWKNNGGVLQAGAIMAGLAGIIGGISYIAKQCDPMMKTPAGQDTDLGKLSSKIDDAKDTGSSVESGSSEDK